MTTGDAFGDALADFLEGRQTRCVIEREDGAVTTEWVGDYFSVPKQWASVERHALRHVRGRVVDVGAGAGRAALALQERGRQVVAIDTSPLAVSVCQKRGVLDARVMSLDDLGPVADSETFLFYGANLALLGSDQAANERLTALRRLAPAGARIIGTCFGYQESADPIFATLTDGLLTMRIRYFDRATDWFAYMPRPSEDLINVAAEAGWQLVRLLKDQGPLYAVVFESTRVGDRSRVVHPRT